MTCLILDRHAIRVNTGIHSVIEKCVETCGIMSRHRSLEPGGSFWIFIGVSMGQIQVINHLNFDTNNITNSNR